MTSPLVSVNNLAWSYIGSDKPALNHVDFQLMPGEVLGVTGPSGAGKTTLCMTINSLIPNNFRGEFSGQVLIKGSDTTSMSVCDLVQEVGLVFQDPESQFMGMTVEEELIFTLENLGLQDDEITRRITHAIRMVHMEDFLQRSPFSLSGGQKQKVAIAACLALEPSVLVLDEPTSELDPIGASEVFAVLRELKTSRQIGIILVTHATEDLATFCDRVLLLSEGEQVCLKSTQEFFSDIPFLERYGVQIPQIVELFGALGGEYSGQVPITLERAVETIRGEELCQR